MRVKEGDVDRNRAVATKEDAGWYYGWFRGMCGLEGWNSPFGRSETSAADMPEVFYTFL